MILNQNNQIQEINGQNTFNNLNSLPLKGFLKGEIPNNPDDKGSVTFAKNGLYYNDIKKLKSNSLLTPLIEEHVQQDKTTFNIPYNVKTYVDQPENVKLNHYKKGDKVQGNNNNVQYCPKNIISSTSENDSSSESSESTIPPAPNGGWGWVVVFASFMIHFINDGVGFAFGVLYVSFLDYFQSTKGQTALVVSLYYAVPLLAGPVASILVDTYGCRKMTILGGFISFVGFFASVFVQRIEALYVTMGLVTGLGLSIVNVASIVIVAFYFDSRRAFATGIATSGSGIGASVLGALIEILLQRYGWRGTVLLFSGLFLNIVVLGALMRPVEWPENLAAERKKRKYQERLNDFRFISKKNPPGAMVSLLTGDIVNLDESNDYNLNTLEYVNHLPDTASPPPPTTRSWKIDSTGDEKSDSDEDNERYRAHSTLDIPTYLTKNPLLVNETYETLHKDYNVDNLVQILPLVTNRKLHLYSGLQSRVGSLTPTHTPPTLLQHPISEHYFTFKTNSQSSDAVAAPTTINTHHLNGPSSTALVINANTNNTQHRHDPLISLHDPHAAWLQHVDRMRKAERYRFLRLNRSNITSKGCMLNTPKYSIRASSCPDVYTSTLQRGGASYTFRELVAELFDTLKSMCDFSMLKDMTYALFFISNFLLCLCDDIPHLYVVDRAILLGVPAFKASLLLSMMGSINTVGQIFFGYLADRPSLDTIYLYTVATAGCGLVCFGYVFVHSYGGLAALSVLYGFMIAANYSLTSIILVDLMGLEEFTSSYGLILTAQGIGSLAGPPIGGLVSDLTHSSYDATFYLAGTLILLSGLIMLVEPVFKRWKKQQRQSRLKLEGRDPIPVYPLIKDYKTNSLLTL